MSGVWVEATDPKTQRKYYYNKETKKTQWTKPAELEAANDGGGNDNSDPESVAANWAQNTDPKTGRVYYYNKITKKTSWNKPACMASSDSASPTSSSSSSASSARTPSMTGSLSSSSSSSSSNPSSSSSPSSVPAGLEHWREAKDPNSGRSYWYNKVSKETTWKNPFPDGVAPTPSSSSSSSSSNVSSMIATRVLGAPVSGPAGGVQGPRSAKELLADEEEEEEDDDDEEDEKPRRPAASSNGNGAPSSGSNRATALKRLADSDDDDDDNNNNNNNYNNGGNGQAKDDGGDGDGDGDDNDNNQPKNIQDLLRDEDSDDEDGKGDKSQAAEMMKLKQARAKIADEDEDDDNESHEFKFAKHRHGWIARFFRTGQHFDDTKLLSFKKSLIKKALLKQNRDLDAEAVQAFKNIMSYMGDRKSSKAPIDHAKKMLRNLMIAPSGLRDEVFMQLIKQTTKNPTIESTVKGWELISFSLATFPPSKHLKTFLLDYLKKNAEDNSRPKVQSLAQLCLERLPVILSMGQRKQVPSSLELQCLMDGKPIPIRVNLCNGTFKSFTIEPYTTVKELEEMLHKKYSLTLTEIFALYETAGPNEERMLDPKDRVCDVIASWENKPLVEEVKIDPKSQKKVKTYEKELKNQIKLEKKEIKFTSLMFKAKLVLKTGNKELMSDPEAVSLIYVQATQDVVTQRYPCAEKDITVLAALQLQASYGDFKKDVHVPGWLKSRIGEVMPASLLEKKGKQSDQLVSEWEQKILSKYQKVAGFSGMEAKLNYLDYVQEWVFYGSSFFLIEQRQFKDYPSPLTMGINSEGVLLMHPEKKAVLENYHYTDIVTWGHSDEKFILVVGNIVQQRKLIFKTSDGKNMNHLIHDYVKFKVKNKAE